MAIVSETELQRRLRALEKGAGSVGSTTVVNANDPYGTGYTTGSQWYNSTTNNLWIFNGSTWDLSFSKLHLRYADDVVNVDESGHVTSQLDVTGFSEYPFSAEGVQKDWRGIFFGPAVGSSDPTDYEWTLTAGESGDTPSFERYYTTTAGLLTEIGDPTTPGSGVTWVDGLGGIPATAYWIAERYTISGITSDWQVYPVQAKDGGIPFVKFIKSANAPTLGDATWIADAILAVEAFTGRDYTSQKEFGYGTVVSIDYDDTTLTGKYIRSGGVDTWVAPEAFIDGDLVVDGTIAAEKIQANSIDSTKIVVTGVNAITYSTVGADASGSASTAESNANIYSSNLVTGVTDNIYTTGTTTIDGGKITTGSITADRIDSRGLSIKDASGNIILAAGSPLAVSNVSGLGSLATADNITLSYVTDSGAMAAIDSITSSNVSTYIDNAAIGNAQIGGAIQSTNFVSGSSGWQIDKAGDAEFNDVIVRGQIEASTLDTDSLIIATDTTCYAPFSFAGTVNYQGGTTSLTLNFPRVYSPTYSTGFLATRAASLSTPVYVTMAQHGDYNTVTASLQISYDGGAYSTLASTSAFLDYRSGLALAHTVVPTGTWSYFDLRWVFSGSQTNQVSSQALVINGT